MNAVWSVAVTCILSMSSTYPAFVGSPPADTATSDTCPGPEATDLAEQQGPDAQDVKDHGTLFLLDDSDVGRITGKGLDGLGDYIRRTETYQPGGDEPDWRGAVERLSSASTKQRSQASVVLVNLLSQARDDEMSGRARWYPSIFASHPSPVCPARQVREGILAVLAEQRKVPAAVPVLRWYLVEEHVWLFQLRAARILAGVPGPEAESLLPQLPSAGVEGTRRSRASRGLPTLPRSLEGRSRADRA